MKSYIYLVFVFLMACKSKSESNLTNYTSGDTTIHKVFANDTLALQETVKAFLMWYKTNYTQANSFGLTYQDKQGNYNVALGNCDLYLNFLKSSGYISDTYMGLWKKYFEDKAIYLKENLSSEGPPEGFEFDLVLITQEPELILNEIDHLQFAVSENNGNKAILQVAGHWGYDFEMTKVNDKWLIEYIATLNYD
jgi:hypothetical protein